MAGSFSSRKVARAARMGGGRRRRPGGAYGWYALLAAIVLVGSGFVAFSRAEHLDESNPGSTPPLASYDDGTVQRAGDRWFEAVGFYTCDEFAPNVTPTDNPSGITTAGDGVILIAPNAKKYAGRNATFGLFAEGAGIKLDRESFQLPGEGSTRYGPGTKCGERDGKLIIREWEEASKVDDGKVVGGTPESILLKNQAAITIAWVPDDFDEKNVPIPETAAGLKQKAEQDAAAQQAQGSTAPEGSVPQGAPGAPEGATPIAPAPNPAAPTQPTPPASNPPAPQ